MRFFFLIPLAGGLVTTGIGTWFLAKKGLKEQTQVFFFLSLMTLGLFGLLEAIAYCVGEDYESTVIILLKLSKASALLSPFLFMSFSTSLRENERWHVYLAPVTLFFVVTGWIMSIEGVSKTSWGWAVEHNHVVMGSSYIFVVLLMLLGCFELYKMSRSLKMEGSRYFSPVNNMLVGFVMLLLTAALSNMLVGLKIVDLPPMFSSLQVFPVIIVTWAYNSSRRAMPIENGE